MASYTASIATHSSVVASIRQTIAEVQGSKPSITIKINGEPESSKKIYTTGERIEGEVQIVAPTDTRFDEISIAFEGWIQP
jgi:hypothetical protein